MNKVRKCFILVCYGARNSPRVAVMRANPNLDGAAMPKDDAIGNFFLFSGFCDKGQFYEALETCRG